MAMFMSITDPGVELQVVMRVGQGYNPDILDDLKTRLVQTYKEALELRVAMNFVQAEREHNEPDGGMDAPV